MWEGGEGGWTASLNSKERRTICRTRGHSAERWPAESESRERKKEVLVLGKGGRSEEEGQEEGRRRRRARCFRIRRLCRGVGRRGRR